MRAHIKLTSIKNGCQLCIKTTTSVVSHHCAPHSHVRTSYEPCCVCFNLSWIIGLYSVALLIAWRNWARAVVSVGSLDSIVLPCLHQLGIHNIQHVLAQCCYRRLQVSNYKFSICHELCLYVVAINLCTSTSIALVYCTVVRSERMEA